MSAGRLPQRVGTMGYAPATGNDCSATVRGASAVPPRCFRGGPLLPAMNLYSRYGCQSDIPLRGSVTRGGTLLSAMARDGPRWPVMARDGPRQAAMARDSPRWPATVRDGPRWPAMVRGGPRRSATVRDDPL